MNRVIKFRAWHKPTKLMYWFDLLWGNHNRGNGYIGMCLFGEDRSIHRFRDNMILVDPDDCDLMQFTGLQDKNGKDIYEGDIAKDKDENTLVIGWSERFASFSIDRNGWAFTHYFGESYSPQDIEVIGNIHEHKHLLK